jgi:hypothetical protein
MSVKIPERLTQLEAHIVSIMLLRSGKYSFLPELLDVVGREQMLSLLQMFAGLQIQFPSTSELERYAKEVSIFFRVHRAKPAQRSAIVKDLADVYLVDEDTVNAIYQKIRKLVEQDLQLRL